MTPEPIDYEKIIRQLPRKQREAFDQICLGNDTCIHKKTGESLVGKGLVRSFKETLPGRFPVVITRYDFTIPAHIAWCALVSKEEA